MSLHKRIILANVLLIFTILLSAGCASKPVTDKPLVQHLNYALTSSVNVLDPGKQTEKSEFQLNKAIFEGLVRMKPDGTIEKAMAESWEIDQDGKRFTFKLRDSTWADGTKVTANDFEYAWKRALRPGNEGGFIHLLYAIKNAEGYHRSQDTAYRGARFSAEEVGLQALDENTLVVSLNKADAAFIQKLTFPIYFPLPQKLCEPDPEGYFQAQKIVGNGPFRISQSESGVKYELVRNEKYWDKDAVRLVSMTWFLPGDDPQSVWRMYQDNRLDVTSQVPQGELAAGIKDKSILVSPLAANYTYLFNTTRKPLDDVRVRQALSYALDRLSLVDNVLQGAQKPATGLVPPGVPEPATGGDFRLNGGNLLPDNNLSEAKSLLAEAGFADGAGFPTLEILISDQPEHLYLAQAIKDEWEKKLGIAVEIKQEEWEKRLSRMQQLDYDLALASGGIKLADASDFLEGYSSLSTYNNTGWGSIEYDNLLKDGAWHEAEKLLASQLPALPIYDYSMVAAVKEGLQGVYLPPDGSGAEFKWAHVE